MDTVSEIITSIVALGVVALVALICAVIWRKFYHPASSSSSSSSSYSRWCGCFKPHKHHPREVTLIGEYDPEAFPLSQTADMAPGPEIAAQTSGEEVEPHNASRASWVSSWLWGVLPSLRRSIESTSTYESTLSNAAGSATQLGTFNSSQANLLSNSAQQAALTMPHVDSPSEAGLARVTIVPASDDCPSSYQLRLVSFPLGTNPGQSKPAMRIPLRNSRHCER